MPSAPGAMPVPVPEEAPAPATAKGSKRKLADREPAGKQASGASQSDHAGGPKTLLVLHRHGLTREGQHEFVHKCKRTDSVFVCRVLDKTQELIRWDAC